MRVGTNENSNGLIRKYLSKGRELRTLSQADGDRIARILNKRPPKRTSEEVFNESFKVALQSYS